jgi:multiple sugar transport system substrate-binding protein
VKKVKKCLALLLVFGFSMGMMAGCKSNKTTSSNANSVGTAPVTLNFWYWEDVQGQYQSTFQPLWDAYALENHITNVTINFQSISNSVFNDKLITAIAAGTAPDIFKVTPATVPELVGLNGLLPLDNYVKNWDVVKDGEIPANVMQMAYAGQKKLYTMPHTNVVLYLYYRKDIFAKDGVQPPTTMDEFYADCKALTRDTNGDGKIDQYGFAMRGASGGQNMWAGLVFNCTKGMDYLDSKGNVAFNTPAVITANQKYIDLYKDGYTPPTAPTDGQQQITQEFESGVAAMLIHHVGSSAAIVNAIGADKVGVTAIPEGPGGRYVTMDPSNIAVSSQTKNKAAALAALQFFCSQDAQDALCKTIGQVPWLKTVSSDSYFQTNPFQALSIQYLPQAHMVPVTSTMANWTGTVFPQTLQRALLGQITSQQMIQTLADALKQSQ